MTAQIINLSAWRVARAAPAGLYVEALRVWMWPVRFWLAWWGIR